MYEKARTFKQGDGLAIVIDDYTGADIGYSSVQFFSETGKLDKAILVWLKNTSEKVVEVNTVNFKATTKAGYTLPVHEYTFRTADPFETIRLEPGTQAKGLLVFAVDPDDVLQQIIYDDAMGNRVARDFTDALVLKMERTLQRAQP